MEKSNTLLNRLTGWPQKTEGQVVSRTHSCSFCGLQEGQAVAAAEYWDLSPVQYIRCTQCELIQVDPMLSREAVAKGCEAYYLREQLREGKKNLAKNMVRSFRKGVYFGTLLKRRGIDIENILEVGPGDGYFSRGLRFVFPKAKVSCLDIVENVLEKIKTRHGFSTLLGTPEELHQLVKKSEFDLIVARDIIEHVSHPDLVLKAFTEALKPGGYLHIITPNGYEDIWTAYCHWKIKSLPSEMLINHVNFFTPHGLKNKLMELGFSPLIWFIYDFNGTRWGRARRISEDQMAETSNQISADQVIQESRKSFSDFEVNDTEVMSKWWIRDSARWLTQLYCIWKEKRRFTLNADHGIGHEIFGVFKKQKPA